ncbi:MAG TPA: ATP-binding cassette domain-containing protein, partial [Methylobacterium sp.]|nr:ATP-binding cassette domain-containing protein [Methylobacterium sp.]
MNARIAETAVAASGGRIEIAGASIRLGAGASAFEVVREISLSVPEREFVCLLGPSGCGKSTLLRALAGHLGLSQGSVSLDGHAVAGPHPDRGIVFQQHTLFPWKRVID